VYNGERGNFDDESGKGKQFDEVVIEGKCDKTMKHIRERPREWGDMCFNAIQSKEYEERMGALKTFAPTKYVSHIDYLTPIFVDLSEPTLPKPVLSNTKKIVTLKDDSKIETKSSTRKELEEYRLKLKEFLKDENAVKTIKRSLHNVMWGQ